MTRSSRRRLAGRVLLVLALTAIGLLVWGAWSARVVLASGQDAEREVRHLADAAFPADRSLPSPDLDAAERHRAAAEEHAERARDAAHAPPLRLAAILPWVGDDVRAVQGVTAGVHVAVASAVPPLLEVAASLDPRALATSDGGLDLTRLQEAAPAASEAADAAGRAHDEVAAIDAASLAGPLRSRVAVPRERLEDLARTASTLDAAMTHLPGALGAGEPRSYLLAFQNLAEARPTGGVIGAWALLEANGGRVRLVETGANDDLERLSGPVRDLGPEVSALYGGDLARSQNVNLSPHFPHAALLLSDLWEAQGRAAPDGVIAIDPVALSTLLKATGPVRPEDGPALNPRNVVDIVQAQVYEEFADRDWLRRDYLAAVTKTVFSAVLDRGAADPKVLQAVVRSARSGHVQVWSPNPGVQGLAERAGVAGVVDPPEPGEFRVHLTNIDRSKLDHYVRLEVTCRPGEVVVGVASSVPAEVPEYVRNHLPGSEPTLHRVLLDLWVPPQWGLRSLQVAGQQQEFLAGSMHGWTVARVPVDVPRGELVEARWDLFEDVLPQAAVAQPLTHPLVTNCAESPAADVGSSGAAGR